MTITLTPKTGNRCHELSTTVGTGDISLLGALPGRQSLLSGLGLTDGQTFYYTIQDQGGGGNWEEGVATYHSASNTFTRTTVLHSSNSNNPVNFAIGPKDVFNAIPAERMLLGEFMSLDDGGAFQSKGVGWGSVAGNACGQGSFDLSTQRTSAVNVASGAFCYSIGNDNFVPGTGNFVFGGQSGSGNALGSGNSIFGNCILGLANTLSGNSGSELSNYIIGQGNAISGAGSMYGSVFIGITNTFSVPATASQHIVIGDSNTGTLPSSVNAPGGVYIGSKNQLDAAGISAGGSVLVGSFSNTSGQSIIIGSGTAIGGMVYGNAPEQNFGNSCLATQQGLVLGASGTANAFNCGAMLGGTAGNRPFTFIYSDNGTIGTVRIVTPADLGVTARNYFRTGSTVSCFADVSSNSQFQTYGPFTLSNPTFNSGAGQFSFNIPTGSMPNGAFGTVYSTSAYGQVSLAIGSSIASISGQLSFAAQNSISSQCSTIQLCRQTSNNTPLELTSNGGNGSTLSYFNRVVILPMSIGSGAVCKLFAIKAMIAAVASDGSCAMFRRDLLVLSNNYVTTIVGAAQTIGTDIGSNSGGPPAGWAVSFNVLSTAGPNVLQVLVTGDNSHTVNWSCRLDVSECEA
jgi:hypothetical protein